MAAAAAVLAQGGDTRRSQYVIAIDSDEGFIFNEEHTQAARHLFGFFLQSQSLHPACVHLVPR